MIGFTRNQFNRSPIKSLQRMKTSTPINVKKYISSNNLRKLSQKNISRKNSNRECISIKKHYFEKINTRISEESESSNLEEENKKNKENKNNNYYINYINNIYEREPHLNKETFIRTPKNGSKKFKKLDDINGKLYKRRNSAFSEQFMSLNFHKKFCTDKGQQVSSPINKLKSSNLNKLFIKKESSEIEVLRHHSNNLNKRKDKGKSKNKCKSKSKGSSKDKNKNSDKKLKSNIKIKKTTENLEIKDNDIEISTKVDTVNVENSNKIKNKTLKNILCCLLNDNELSTEND